MTCSAAKVHKTSFGKKDDVFTIYIVNINLWLHGIFRVTVAVIQPGYIDLNIEVADVTYNYFVFHPAEMFFRDEVAATRSCHHDVCFCNGVYHALHFKTVHRCLKCADRIDLSNDHAAAGTRQGSSGTFTHIAITTYNGNLTGQHHIGSAADGVNQGFFTAVFVIELRLGYGIIHVDRRNRQGTLRHPFVQPVNTSSGFFRQTFNVLNQLRVFIEHNIREVTTIIQDHIQGAVCSSEEQGLFNTPVSFFNRLSFPGKHTDTCSSNGRSGMILCGEDVAGAPFYLSTEGHKGLDQHGSLDGHVQATSDPGTFQGLLCTIFFTNGHQTGHFCFSKTDFFATPFSQGDIFYLVGKGKVDGLCYS